MRFGISTFTSRRNPHVEIDQSLPHPAIRRSVLLSVNLNVQILIAGSSKLLEREKMRFGISTFTSRRNPHVEIDQSLPHPAIRRSVLLSGTCVHERILIAGSSKLLEREKMRFGISTCTSRRNLHAEIDQSLPHPAIRRSGSVNLISCCGKVVTPAMLRPEERLPAQKRQSHLPSNFKYQ